MHDLVVDALGVSDLRVPILWIEGEVARFALQHVETIAQQAQQRLGSEGREKGL